MRGQGHFLIFPRVRVGQRRNQLSCSTLVFRSILLPCTCIYMIQLHLFTSSHTVSVYCRFIYINTTVSTPTADRGMSPVTQCSASRRIRPLADVQITSSPFHPQAPTIMTTWGSDLENSCGMDSLPHHSISMGLIGNHSFHTNLFPKQVIMYSLYSIYILRKQKKRKAPLIPLSSPRNNMQ